MSKQISAKGQAIIDEEEALLKKVIERLKAQETNSEQIDYIKELNELRQEVIDARIEDRPPLLAEMARLEALAANQTKQASKSPVALDNPYFGHLELDENGKKTSVLIGKRTFIDSKHGVSIVDWRNAPISRIYYCYSAGDEFFEIINNVDREGVVVKRRAIGIEGGILRRIAGVDGTFVKNDAGEWQEIELERCSLHGGQGSAVRPKSLSVLGVGSDGKPRMNSHLPEISALIDPEQFKLISNECPGILVVKGSAGSGKTTVALHRVAYLLFSDKRRYTSDKVLVVVPNKALVAYTSAVLPSLGINNVKAVTFYDWCAACRKRIAPHLPESYSDNTPAAVSRFKRHPMIIKAIVAKEAERSRRLLGDLKTIIKDIKGRDQIMAAWNNFQMVPFEQRRQMLILWLKDQPSHPKLPVKPNIQHSTKELAINILERYPFGPKGLFNDWANIITDESLTRRLIAENCPDEFKSDEIDQIVDWNKELYQDLISASTESNHNEEEDDDDLLGDDEAPLDLAKMVFESMADNDKATLDREDDVIMLAIYQHNVGRLPGRNGRLEYNHLMVDEVQDLSPFEVRVMLRCTSKEATITLSGDDAQAIVAESSFKSWDYFISQLGAQKVMMSQLQIAYRSTAEVMVVAQAVLGDNRPAPKVTRHGAPVELHRFSEMGSAVDFLGSALRDLMNREPNACVAVIARHPPQAEAYYTALKEAEVPHIRLVDVENFKFAPGIDVTDVREVKGLEFDYVILVDVNSDCYPDDELARNYLHVGMTRAAHQLWCITTKRPSPLLPKWLF